MTTIERYTISNPEAHRLLETGRATRNGQAMYALPTRAVDDNEHGRMIEFSLVPEKDIVRPSPVRVWLTAVRMPSLTATITPCIATLLFGLYRGFAPSVLNAILALVGAVLLQVSVNLWNDLEDHRRTIDVPGTLGGSGVLQRGWLSPAQVKRVSLLSLSIGLLCGLPAFIQHPKDLGLIGLLACVGTFGYSGWPFGFKYRALGDAVVALLCGPGLTVGYSLAVFGQYQLADVLLGCSFGLAAVGILHTNNIQDIAIDQATGAKTVASVMGEQASRVYLVTLYMIVWLALTVSVVRGSMHVAVLIASLLALPLVIRLITRAIGNPSAYPLLRIEAAQVHLMLGLLICVGMGVSIALR